MSTLELVRADGAIVHPYTGELLELGVIDSDELAELRRALVDVKAEIDRAAELVDDAIVSRIDAAVRSGDVRGYTVTLPRFRVEVPSPTAGAKVDGAGLRAAAAKRAPELGLAPAAIEGAFTPKTTYTLRRRDWGALEQQAPELLELRRQYTAPPARRRATVTPLSPQPAIEATAEEDYPL